MRASRARAEHRFTPNVRLEYEDANPLSEEEYETERLQLERNDPIREIIYRASQHARCALPTIPPSSPSKRWAAPTLLQLHKDCRRERLFRPGHPPWPTTPPAGRRTFGTTRSISARCASNCRGSMSFVPSVSAGSSTVKPGFSVAISKSTPPGSWK
jgi:hypothetical protein